MNVANESLKEKHLKKVQVRRALVPEDLRKYHGISEDATAAHYFKSSKQVLDLMLQENEF